MSYLPLEYTEVNQPFEAANQSAQPEPPSGDPPSVEAEPAPDPAELLEARIEAERHAIRAQVRQETEREIQRARTGIAHAIEEFAHQREEYFRRAEEEVVNLTLAIARRLIHRETQIDPRLLAGLVNYELEQLDAATSVRLFVSPQTLGYWNEAAPAMSRIVEVAPDPALAQCDARIETALGSATVSFERELKEIERGFFDLLSHRPSATESKTAGSRPAETKAAETKSARVQ
jgi:flagellar assembly protein FliH